MSPDPPFTELMTRLREGDPHAAAAVFDRFARRLVGLAASRLPRELTPKLDAEDVVQSVFKSFFARQADGRLVAEGWDGLWTILTVLTVRKCGHKIERFRAARRDVRREAPIAAPDADSASSWEAPDPEPRPEEAALLADTLDDVLRGLREDQRPIVLLRLHGFLQREIAEQVGCAERTVERVLSNVRQALEAKAS